MSDIIVVIGAGVAGVSTCYCLSKNLPEGFSAIHCFDDGNRIAASRDPFKIVRDDYTDKETMIRAMKSHKEWRTEWSEFHEDKPRLVAYKSRETYEQIANNRKELGLAKRPVLSSQEVWKKYGLQLPDDTTIVLDEDDSLVNLSGCIKSMRNKCEELGVKFSDAHVDKLMYNDSGFSGVIVGDRKIEYIGATVVVATGPWFQSLLRDSGMPEPKPERMAECVQIFSFSIEVNVPHTLPIVSELSIGEYHVLLP